MNKKGFTLVELLAVIAILAILVVMAMPNVLDMFNKSKENSFRNEANSILRQSATEFISNPPVISGSNGKYVDDTTADVMNYNPNVELSINTSLRYELGVDASTGKVKTALISNGKFCFIGQNANGVKYIDNDTATTLSGYTTGNALVPYSPSTPCASLYQADL